MVISAVIMNKYSFTNSYNSVMTAKTNRRDAREVLPPEERRERLFAAASRVFASRGFAGTKISDIAQAAGISQGLMYRYFDSKETLFTELIAHSFARLNAAAAMLEEMPAPADEKILLALRQVIGGMRDDPAFPERVLLIAQASISEGIPAATKAVIASESMKPYEAVARIMAAGQHEGTVGEGEPMELSTLFWTTIKGLALHRVSQGDRFRAPDTAIISRLFLTTKRQEEPKNG